MKLNLPTPEGVELGSHLSRLLGPEIAKHRASHPNTPDLCGTCAFRPGTLPNGCAQTLMVALKCIMEGHVFDCHEDLDADGNPTRACAGWVAARAANPGKKVEMPWGHPGSVP